MARKLFKNQRTGKNPRKLTVERGTSFENSNLEDSLYKWVMEHKVAENSISSTGIVDKAIFQNPNF